MLGDRPLLCDVAIGRMGVAGPDGDYYEGWSGRGCTRISPEPGSSPMAERGRARVDDARIRELQRVAR